VYQQQQMSAQEHDWERFLGMPSRNGLLTSGFRKQHSPEAHKARGSMDKCIGLAHPRLQRFHTRLVVP
jgi:hypothetical protein